MRIGVGIFLVTVGAIIAFGVRDTSGPVDFTVVGVVIMLAGASGIWLSYQVANRSRQDHTNESVMKSRVEKQYNTNPHQYPLDQEIDVTPTEYKDRPTDRH